MSIVTSPYTIPAALAKADEIIGRNRQWNSINAMQKNFLEILALTKRSNVSIPEIDAISSWEATVINQFLKERGFSIHLDPFTPDTFGVAAVLKVLLKWLYEGTSTPLTTEDRKSYPGVYMDRKFLACSAPGHNNPIMCISTQSTDMVYLTMLDTPPTDEFNMILLAQQFAQHRDEEGFMEIHFPMVNLDVQSNLDWLLGLWTMSEQGPKAKVSQAIRQTKLQVNEIGVKVEEAVALAITLESFVITQCHQIDRPFLMWIERDNLSLPWFVGYITQEHWKDPGQIA